MEKKLNIVIALLVVMVVLMLVNVLGLAGQGLRGNAMMKTGGPAGLGGYEGDGPF